VNAHLRNREVEDTCIARLGFLSGAQAVLTVSHATRESRDTIEIFGSAGSAHIPILNQGRLRIVTAAGTREEEHPAPATCTSRSSRIRAAVQANRPPTVTGEIGQEVSRVLAAIYARA
jgi:predicted dehydrogenase